MSARSALATPLVCAAVAVLGVFALRTTGALERVELASEDALLEARDRFASTRKPPDGPWVTVVRISEGDLRVHGHPLPDAVLADALERILPAEPRGVGVDLFRDLPNLAGRERLAALAAANPGILFVESLAPVGGGGVPPPSFEGQEVGHGFGDVVVDDDGRVRRLLLLASLPDGRVARSLPWLLARRFLEPEGIELAAVGDEEDVRRPLQIGAGRLERMGAGDGAYAHLDDRGYQIRADFRHGRSAYDVVALEALLAGRVPEAVLRDRVVLLGSAAQSTRDRFREPTDGGTPRAGVELHALAVDQLLRTALRGEAAPHPLPRPLSFAGAFGLALAGSLTGLARISRTRAIAVVAATLAALALGVAGGLAVGWLAPVALFLAAYGVAAVLGGAEHLRRERRERLVLDRLFATHVPSKVRDALWRERSSFLVEGRLRARRATATVLFADLVAYAELAETTPPDLLLEWLGEFVEVLAGTVERHGGLIDDYWGDGLKASFGALPPPVTRDDVAREALSAVRCAFDMDAAMEALNARWRDRGLGPGRMRIGIHTGPVIVGSLGGLLHHKLTTVGDTVNVASRLESFLREHPDALGTDPAVGPRWLHVLASEETVACLAGSYATQVLGEHALRGRRGKICIHRILGPLAGPEGGTLFSGPERGTPTTGPELPT